METWTAIISAAEQYASQGCASQLKSLVAKEFRSNDVHVALAAAFASDNVNGLMIFRKILNRAILL